MNRHTRRAAARQTEQQPEAQNHPITHTFLGGAPLGGDSSMGTAGPTPSAGSIPVLSEKPSFVIRALAKVLLSSWVLARVQHPDVEQLLMSFAIQTGRQDVADELVRRHALRSQSPL